PHSREGRAAEGVEGSSAPLAVVGLEAAEALPAGAVAAMPDDLRAAAVRALVVVGDLDGASRDERFGYALGQQTRRLRLKIDQLIDRGVGGDLALQRLESGMVHGGVPSSPEIGERSWNSKNGTAGNPACWLRSTSKSNCATRRHGGIRLRRSGRRFQVAWTKSLGVPSRTS